jgi:hypothetical protein
MPGASDERADRRPLELGHAGEKELSFLRGVVGRHLRYIETPGEKVVRGSLVVRDGPDWGNWIGIRTDRLAE